MNGKPDWQHLKQLCPDADERLVREHLARLDDSYFRRFGPEEVARHVRGLSRVTPEHPVEVLAVPGADNRCELTVLAFDYPGEFSLITGVLAGLGFSIVTGDVYTYARAAAPGPESRQALLRRGRHKPVFVDPLQRRRIVDHFSGDAEPGAAPDAWLGELRRRLERVIGLLEQGGREEAKQQVNEMVARRLEELTAESAPVLYPVTIEVENHRPGVTRLRVVSEDTPAFLYALSNALALRDVAVESVRIATVDRRVEDELDVVDDQGEPIRDPDALDRIKLSVLLTKQFTHFLGKAPDPYSALARFEQLVSDILALPERGQWLGLFSNPRHLQDLARLLGASDFLWEDVIRQQYETLLPMLRIHVGEKHFAEPVDTIAARLEAALAGAYTPEEQRRRLNEFKDREIYLIDFDYILNAGANFRALAEHLTVLAEGVVNAAVRLAYARLTARYGVPRAVAGLEARHAVFGLGKFGGAALGYASDIELLFVYSDNGRTDGTEPVDNVEFFEHLAREATALILAKREGIFHVDLRLRPYGEDGLLASSLDHFCGYYAPQGAAMAYERLALVRLRAVGGDPELGAQVERLRDEFVYASGALDIRELRELRQKQLAEKTRPGEINVKFSPGALVDLEYDVQILQVIHGRERADLRTPRIHRALNALRDAGVLESGEGERLAAAYDFLRYLINGLRMLRGSARDLCLPPAGSDEYLHLARRLGYEPKPGLTPAQQLHLEYEAHTAAVRAFVERHFGRDSLPGPAAGSVADLVLSEAVAEDLRRRILAHAGFRDPDRAYVNLRGLAAEPAGREKLARLAVLACDMLAHQPDPDMALNNWERFAAGLPDRHAHYERLLSQPMRLSILLNIFATSQFLADTLARNPEFFDWATDPANLRGVRRRTDLDRELEQYAGAPADTGEWLDAIRRFRRRETLRIGTRDIGLHAPIREVTLDLSTLAESLTQAALDRAWGEVRRVRPSGPDDLPERFCVLAFGKLGGLELNYSSDIDLLGAYAERGAPGEDEPFVLAMERLQHFLSQYTGEGHAYRVDLRLRPFGKEGALVPSLAALEDYYRHEADLPEIQALLKLRPVAGSLAVGQTFLERIRPVLLQRRRREDLVASVEKVRGIALHRLAERGETLTDVKSGLGGLRDVEFMVQGLQLLHAPDHPELLGGNTLLALDALARARVLDAGLADSLREDYVFLRRVEHYLQILEDRQIHALPQDPRELEALAKRMLGPDAGAGRFMERLRECLGRVRKAYEEHWLRG